MRKTRIFLGLLLIIALMAFAGCGINDGTTLDPDTPTDVTDNDITDNDVTDNDITDNLGNDVDNAVDNAGDAVEDLITDGAVNKNKDNL